MNAFLGRFLRDTAGATAMEYALLLALVSLAPMAAFGVVGDLASGLIGEASTELAVAGPTGRLDVLPVSN